MFSVLLNVIQNVSKLIPCFGRHAANFIILAAWACAVRFMKVICLQSLAMLNVTVIYIFISYIFKPKVYSICYFFIYVQVFFSSIIPTLGRQAGDFRPLGRHAANIRRQAATEVNVCRKITQHLPYLCFPKRQKYQQLWWAKLSNSNARSFLSAPMVKLIQLFAFCKELFIKNFKFDWSHVFN